MPAMLGGGGAGAATLLLIATPLWLYGWVFWEHAPATLLCLAATLILTRATARQSILVVITAGGLLGIATSCRPEILIYLGASAIALGVVRRSLRAPAVLVAAALAVFLPLAFATPGLSFSAHLTQNVGPAALAATDPMTLLRSRFLVAVDLIGGVLRPSGFPKTVLWCTVTTLAFLLVLAFAVLRRSSNTVPVTLSLLVVGLLAWAPNAFAFFDERTLIIGLLSTCPVAILALTDGVVALRRSAAGSEESLATPNRGLVTMTAVCFTAGTLLLSPNEGGFQWGPRYVLPVFPLLACLLCSNDETVEVKGSRPRRRLRRAVAGVLIGASVITQSVGAANHIRMQGEKAASLSRMTSLPGHYVVTDAWYFPQEAALAILRTGKVVLMVKSADDLIYAVKQLEQVGVHAFTFVSQRDPGSQPRVWDRFREAPEFHFIPNPFDLRVYEFVDPDSLAEGQAPPHARP